MNDSRNINGWILNPMHELNDYKQELWKAKKNGVVIIAPRADIIQTIKEMEKYGKQARIF